MTRESSSKGLMPTKAKPHVKDAEMGAEHPERYLNRKGVNEHVRIIIT
jgi:hypothetical protein